VEQVPQFIAVSDEHVPEAVGQAPEAHEVPAAVDENPV